MFLLCNQSRNILPLVFNADGIQIIIESEVCNIAEEFLFEIGGRYDIVGI